MLVADHLTYAHPGGAHRYDFSFSAAPGEITAIEGQSGSGKSTLLDIVAGFLTPSGGRLRLDRVDLLPLRPEQRPVSILFQSDSIFEHLSAARNVALGLPTRLPPAQLRADVERALGEVGLAGKADQAAATLSGGEKQRVALARTLLRNRAVLLLDEPFSALDDETRAAVRALVLRLTRENGWTTLLVSHHADDADVIATQRYRLVEGQLNSVSGNGGPDDRR